MRKGLSAFKLVPQRSKHHSVHKKPLSPKNPCRRMPKNHCHSMPKKGGHDAYPLSHELQIQNWNSKTWTVCSNGPTPKFTKTSKLNWTVQNESWQCPNTLVICYYILYVFYFYYILFYIICFLFLLYVILYYINCHNRLGYFYYILTLIKNLHINEGRTIYITTHPYLG